MTHVTYFEVIFLPAVITEITCEFRVKVRFSTINSFFESSSGITVHPALLHVFDNYNKLHILGTGGGHSSVEWRCFVPPLRNT